MNTDGKGDWLTMKYSKDTKREWPQRGTGDAKRNFLQKGAKVTKREKED